MVYNSEIEIVEYNSEIEIVEKYGHLGLWYLGDNCIENLHLGRCIVGFTVGNFVLRREVRSQKSHILLYAVKLII